MPRAKASDKQFWDAYERLSWEGKCDCPGGGEYERVLNEWKRLGRPEDVDAFIIVRANCVPRPDWAPGDDNGAKDWQKPYRWRCGTKR